MRANITLTTLCDLINDRGPDAFHANERLADTARDIVEDLASEWICGSGDDMFAAHASDVRRAAALHIRCEISDAIHGLHYAMAAGPFVVEIFGFATPL